MRRSRRPGADPAPEEHQRQQKDEHKFWYANAVLHGPASFLRMATLALGRVARRVRVLSGWNR